MRKCLGSTASHCYRISIALRSATVFELFFGGLNRELEAYPTVDRLAETELKADVPSTELFRYNYASPIWAPTWAGWVILLCVFLILVIIIRILIWCVLRIALFFLDKH